MDAINVTKTYLPPLEEYVGHLEEIWSKGWITNHGEAVTRLEKALKEYLGVKHLFLVVNGTVALQIALKALDLKGEIITTPFSYVATTSSIVWQNCVPVFADIEPDTLTIDIDKVKKAINENTTAVMATHVYGNSADIEALDRLAREYGLNVIYDGAHAFGVKYRGQSIFNHGDISTLSFHATKLFHTAEGGGLICGNDELAHRISYMRNFGHRGQDDFWGLGINGKMSELHAALGLCILPKMTDIIARRKYLCTLYDTKLIRHNLKLSRPSLRQEIDFNYAYYPVLFQDSETMSAAGEALNEKNIFPRRYFYPPLNRLNYVEYSAMPVAEDIASRILCLPLSHELRDSDVVSICEIIEENV